VDGDDDEGEIEMDSTVVPMRMFYKYPSLPSRPLTHADPAAHHNYLQSLNPPDSDESEDSDLIDAEFIEAVIESTCINTVDLWGEPAITKLR
jgi:hypothetical protein